MQLVWFKRDLRLHDHAALIQASKKGAILPLYILEPALWQQPDMSYRHYLFLQQSLDELDQSLKNLGHKLVIKVGDAVDILNEIKECHPIAALWSHQETWNGWTYQRDKAVKRWCYSNNIEWHEPVQNGVIRCLNNRNGWSAHWYQQISKPILQPPNSLSTVEEQSHSIPSHEELGLKRDGITEMQLGGRRQGLKLLHSFLNERGEGYTKEMSSPLTCLLYTSDAADD